MTRRTLVFPAAVATLLVAGALGIRGNWPWTRLSDTPTSRPILVHSPFRVVSDTLQQGETVSALLHRQGITGLDLSALASALHFDPRKIKAGLVFSVRRDARTDSATHVEFRPSADERLRFIRTAAGGWSAQAVPIRWTTDTVRCSAEIQTNLYAALAHGVCDGSIGAGESDKLAWELADINAYALDFSRDVQPGDRIVTVLERQTSEEGETRIGAVLADRYVSKSNKTYEAFGYPDARGNNEFYDGKGAALKRAFLVSPVDFRYISSNFSLSRFHPILGLFRKHEGVDYAAAAGSPVRAAGDGVVTVAGYNGGYGNLIEIRHENGVTTRYGHLSHIALGIRPGTRVSQGEQIGLVGMTGLATAPHLHYEFRVDGIARDPRSIKSESGAPLPSGELAAFQRRRALLTELLGGAAPVTSASE